MWGRFAARDSSVCKTRFPMREKSCDKMLLPNMLKSAKSYGAMAYQNKEAQVLQDKKSPMQASEATSS